MLTPVSWPELGGLEAKVVGDSGAADKDTLSQAETLTAEWFSDSLVYNYRRWGTSQAQIAKDLVFGVAPVGFFRFLVPLA